MLVNLKEILRIAEAKKIAIGAFNTPNLESVLAVISAAEELNVPVIIQHAQVHEDICPLRIIGKVMVQCAKDAKVPVCVHLDHGEDLAYLQEALDLGFTSIMYDGSVLPYEENVANTCIAVSMAKKYNASVESEIGTMGAREGGGEDLGQIYTNPQDAERFVKDTGIDALACSFGTAHGIYAKEPRLDFKVLEEIKKRVDIPLVMHGGSGVSDEDYRKVIAGGIRKINYYTYMAKAGGENIEQHFQMNRFPISKDGKEYEVIYTVVEKGKSKPTFYHDIVTWGVQAMKNNCMRAMRVFTETK